MSRTAVWLILLIAQACSPDQRNQAFVRAGPDWSPDAVISASGPSALLVWAPWCEECLDLLPAFDQLARQRGDALTMATVCIVEADDDLLLVDLPETSHSTHYVWRRTLSEALAEIDVRGIPALVVSDGTGRPARRIAAGELDGPLTAADLADAIDAVTP